jgi:L-malate glycosyltransferase
MARDFCSWAFGKRSPERMFFVSAGNLENCRPGVSGIVPEDCWRVLNNGLDLQHFRPDSGLRNQFRAEYGLGSDRVVGVACALRARKQLEHLVAAVERLPDDVRVVIAGGSVPDEAAYSIKLLDEVRHRLGNRLVLTGHLTELRPFYNALDLFVNTSQEEACSISVLEAMACGCPVIGYASRSVDSQILPGGGEITPQDDIPALTTALKQWLDDPERIARTRMTARQRVEAAFDMRQNCELLWREYDAVLGTIAPASDRKKVFA